MQVVHLHWSRESMDGTGFEELLIPCTKLEVVAYLAVTEKGVRQLMRCEYREGFGPEDLSNSQYLTFEETLRGDGEETPVVVFNTHPLAIGGVDFEDIAVLPPYTISDDGISITIRGVASGIKNFLDLARKINAPDNIKVIKEIEEIGGPKGLLGERQWEVVQAAVQWGYYDNPKKISMRKMAEQLDMARSTLGEHLNNAEAVLMRWLVNQD